MLPLTEPSAQKFFLGCVFFKGLAQCVDFDRVAQQRAGAVRLNIRDGLRLHLRYLQGFGDHLRLTIDARRREPNLSWIRRC